MTTEHQTDTVLSGDILAHLGTQIASARRMLAVVLEQAAAIRARRVQEIVRLAGALQAEMHRREGIELERIQLLQRASVKLAVSADDVTMSMLTSVMDEASAQTARARTAELRGLLSEIQREHSVNRALMQQELAFLDHLLRLAGGAGGYGAAGDHVAARKRAPLMRRPVFELEV